MYSKYVCERCKDPFYTKSELLQHINRKNKCEERETPKNFLIECKCECTKEFSNPRKLKEHIEKCPVIKYIKNEKSIVMGNSNNVTIKNMNSNNDNVKIINNIMIPHWDSPDNNVKGIISGVPITTKVIIVSYLDGFNISQLPSEDQEKIVDPLTNPYNTLIELKHFNKTIPSYQNIYYKKSLGIKGYVYHDYGWKPEKIITIVKNVIESLKTDLERYMYKIGLSLTAESELHLTKQTMKPKYEEISNQILGIIIKYSKMIEPIYEKTKKEKIDSLDKTSSESTISTEKKLSKKKMKK